MKHVLWICGLFVLFCIFFIALGIMASKVSHAHGWYDPDCCSDKDCEMMAEKFLPMTAKEWILPNGERVAIDKTRPSLDGDFHWCRYNGNGGVVRPSGQPICLYVPPGGV